MDGSEASTAGRAEGPPPDRRQDLLYLGVLFVILAVFLTFSVLNILEERRRSGHVIPIWEPITWEATSGLFFFAVAWPLIALTRRFWPVRGPWPQKIAVQVLAAAGVSLTHVLVIGWLRWAVYRIVGGHYDPLAPLGDWPYEARKDVFAYTAIVGFYVMWREVRRPRAAAIEGSPDVLEVRDGARRHFVPLEDVVWIEAAGNYVELHRDGGGLLHRASLSDMERQLSRAGFVRIHRSRLVRREAISDVESKPTGDFLVRLRDGRELVGSRRYRRPLLAN